MVVVRKKAETKKSFANMITVIRLHLMSYVNLFEFIRDTYKAWRKMNTPTFKLSESMFIPSHKSQDVNSRASASFKS